MRWAGWDRWLGGRGGLRRLTLAYLVSGALCGCVAVAAATAFVDLHVYRSGAAAIVHGVWLYGVRQRGLPFTYPPFAAVAFTPLAVAPWWVAVGLALVLNVAGTPVMFYLALRLRPVESWLTRADAVRLALVVSVVAIWLEPVYTTVAFGQVNILLTVMVLIDLTLPDDSPFKGVATGVAAGIKLIPLIFVLYLAATHRIRAAVTALAAFAATIALGYAVAPHASQYYWADLTFLQSSHVSQLSNDWNQSLLGAVSRTVGYEAGSQWLVLAVAVGLAGLALAAQAGRRGNDAIGYGLCAVTGLLVSPISWTHHWVMAVPALLLVALAVWRRRHEAPRRARLSLSAIGVLAAIGWTGIVRHQPPLTAKQQLHLSVFWQVVSEIYVLAGLAALGIAATVYLRERAHRGRVPAVATEPALVAGGQPVPEPSGGVSLRPRTSE